MKKISLLATLAVVLGLLSSCGLLSAPEPQRQHKTYYGYFNTETTFYSYRGDSKEEFLANCDAAAALLAEYHKLFDI